MLQKNKPSSHNKAIVEKHNGLLEILMLIDVLQHINQDDKKVFLDPILSKILNAYENLDTADASPDNKKEEYTSIMNELTDEINNLVKDL